MRKHQPFSFFKKMSSPLPNLPVLSALAISVILAFPVMANGEETPLPIQKTMDELTSLSLEELMNIDVSSLMKSSTRLSDAAGAIVVITNDDIRRSGATTIPEALRLVPGMNVGRLDGNKWSISIRGIAGQFSNNLLVLVDGRSVYTPLFAGVWWDQQDVMMEEIDRIEVIRGPGASLWGANAVNGVINILTKSAKNTQGALASGFAGDQRNGMGLRYGTKLGDDSYFSLFGRYTTDKSSTALQTNQYGADASRLSKVGFHFDKTLTAIDTLKVQGEAFDGYSGGADLLYANVSALNVPVLTSPFNSYYSNNYLFHGNYLSGNWDRKLANGSNISTKIYWDSHTRHQVAIDTIDRVTTFDFDFQHNFDLTEQQKFIWGLGYRRASGNNHNGNIIAFSPAERTDNIYSLFMQDEIALSPSLWKVTLGTKVEHNPTTGYEIQPNARLLWTPNDKNSIWASVSRSVRTPHWAEQNLNANLTTIPPNTPFANPSPFPMLITTYGNPKIKSVSLLAYEMGWRGLLTPTLSADAALYYFNYHRLSGVSPGTVQMMGGLPPSYLILPTEFTNQGYGHSYGGELSVSWQVCDSWKLHANYSLFRSTFELDSNAPTGSIVSFSSGYPQNQAMLWSQHTLSSTLSLDLNLRHSSDIMQQNTMGAYTALDARLAWKPRHDIELALVGRNLTNKGQFEADVDQNLLPTKNLRGVYGTVRVEF